MQAIHETQRIQIAKWVDEYLGRWLIRLASWPLSFRRRTMPKPIERILFIKFWGIGSIILAEPALRCLRKKFPQARIDFLTLSQNRELFALIPHVDQVHAIEFAYPLRFLLSALALIPRLSKERYDLIFDAEFFANFSALVARLAGGRRVIGFSRPGAIKSRLLDVAVPFIDEQHAAENFLRLAMSASPGAHESRRMLHDESTWPRIFISPALNRKRIFHGRAYVVMNVNASPLALERRWPQENFVELAAWLAENYKTDLVLIGSKAEVAYTAEVAKKIGARDRVMSLAGALRLTELAEVIKSSVLFISNDSGPLHLAAAQQKPVVGFYGPETPARFGPLCRNRLIFYLDLPCSPCMSVDNAKTVNCTNHLRCTRELNVAMVIPQLQGFIERQKLLTRMNRTKPHEKMQRVRKYFTF
jgi:heptosyltransferase-2